MKNRTDFRKTVEDGVDPRLDKNFTRKEMYRSNFDGFLAREAFDFKFLRGSLRLALANILQP